LDPVSRPGLSLPVVPRLVHSACMTQRTQLWMVDDRLWKLIAPLTPPQPPPRGPGGRPRTEDRAVLEEILFELHTGCRWRDLPPALGCGSGHTAWRRLLQVHRPQAHALPARRRSPLRPDPRHGTGRIRDFRPDRDRLTDRRTGRTSRDAWGGQPGAQALQCWAQALACVGPTVPSFLGALTGHGGRLTVRVIGRVHR
jgi:transposase